MDYRVEILADSVGPHEVRLTTFALRYPRAAVHEDFLTHRQFSRNASSSRAMPVATMIERADWTPEVFGRNQRGMGAAAPIDDQESARIAWREARSNAVESAEFLVALGVAKEDANLLLRPFEWIDVVVSSTSWENFFRQRSSQSTGLVRRQLKRVADGMRDLLVSGSPMEVGYGGWHLPYVTANELSSYPRVGDVRLLEAAYASAMRCARVSHARHDGTRATIAEDSLACVEKMLHPGGEHWSPLEHPARCAELDTRPDTGRAWGNYGPGWLQLRKHHLTECVFR